MNAAVLGLVLALVASGLPAAAAGAQALPRAESPAGVAHAQAPAAAGAGRHGSGEPANETAPREASSGPQDPAGRMVAITNARLLRVSGPPIEGGTLVIRDGRIAAVGAGVASPPGARVIDATGKVVTPGLLDSWTHLGVVEIDLVDATADFTTESDDITAAFDVADGLNPFSTLIPITRVEGITRAVVAPEPGMSLVAGQGVLIDLSGGPVEGDIHKDPVAMYASLGEAGADLTGGARGAAVLRLREVLQDALDYAAHREAFESNRRREYAVSRLDLEALVPVVRGTVPLAVAARRASDILVALRLAREFHLRVVLLGADEAWMVAREIARAGAPVILNPLQNIPGFESLGATLENAARLNAAGVRVAFASFESHNSRKLKQAAGNAVAYGMPYPAALEAVTLAPARIWGIADRYGSLEPGKDADVVVWDGDPFELTTRVERVFIRGHEMAPDSRQHELLDRYRHVANPGDAARPSLAPRTGPPGGTGAREEGGRERETGRGPAGPGQRAPAVEPAVEERQPAEVPGEEPARPEAPPAEPARPETPPAEPPRPRPGEPGTPELTPQPQPSAPREEPPADEPGPPRQTPDAEPDRPTAK